jgi:hypothetical protein
VMTISEWSSQEREREREREVAQSPVAQVVSPDGDHEEERRVLRRKEGRKQARLARWRV